MINSLVNVIGIDVVVCDVNIFPFGSVLSNVTLVISNVDADSIVTENLEAILLSLIFVLKNGKVTTVKY